MAVIFAQSNPTKAEMLFRWDDYLFHLLYTPGGAGARGAVRAVAIALSLVGGGWGMLGIIPLAFVPRLRRLAAWLTVTLGGTALLVFLLKRLFSRGRPYTVYTALHDALMATATDFSFPSGHAAGSFAFALFVTFALGSRSTPPPHARIVSALVLLFALGVALSRVVLGFHFPSDITAGALLGASIGAFSGARFSRTAPSHS